ncbi:Arc domain-containing protein [Rhizobium sp. TH2]|uniref:Arc domain-containing protein n=1 Tax=Rhizobium sp. TH2 TaxID=2775403 RepID=UPI002157DDA2|nr:Arc domain-containing protein [Rhizobium sp. TH2]UVC08660.1 Arc domain-containing protein [Rhizobium sp. TH2]
MSDDHVQFKIKLPEHVKGWLAAEANRNMRSQSAEVVLAIKEKMIRQQSSETKNGTVSA